YKTNGNTRAISALFGFNGNILKPAGREETVDRLGNFARLQRVANFQGLRRGKVGRIQILRGRILNPDDFLPFELCDLRKRTDCQEQREKRQQATLLSQHVGSMGASTLPMC